MKNASERFIKISKETRKKALISFKVSWIPERHPLVVFS
jgi:hypothetical protein